MRCNMTAHCSTLCGYIVHCQVTGASCHFALAAVAVHAWQVIPEIQLLSQRVPRACVCALCTEALRSTKAKAAFAVGSAAATPTLEYSTEPCTVLLYSSLCPAYHEYREQYPPTTSYREYCEYHARCAKARTSKSLRLNDALVFEPHPLLCAEQISISACCMVCNGCNGLHGLLHGLHWVALGCIGLHGLSHWVACGCMGCMWLRVALGCKEPSKRICCCCQTPLPICAC